MRRVVRILGWSPTARLGKLTWEGTAFRLLWSTALAFLLMLSMHSWLGHRVALGEVGTEERWGESTAEPDWNADLRLSDGRCLVIATREYVEC